MGYNYASAQTTALGLVESFGTALALSRVSGGVYDEVTGETTSMVSASTPAKLVFLPGGTGDKSLDQRFKEGLRKGSHKAGIIAAKGLDFAPEPGDQFEFEGAVWDVAGVTALSPAGVPVLYFFVAHQSLDPTA